MPADTQANILLNFVPGEATPMPDGLVIALHAAFVATMVCTFPTMSHGLRTSLHALALPDRAETVSVDHRRGYPCASRLAPRASRLSQPLRSSPAPHPSCRRPSTLD